MHNQLDELARYCAQSCEMNYEGGCLEGNDCTKCHLATDIAESIYNAGYRKQSEWISVEERLPEKNVRVLVYIKSSRSYTRIDTDRLDDIDFVRWANDVTHWMPVPEPPKMKGE